jgi:PAS domain-containing protein
MLLTGEVLACYGRAAAAMREAERTRDAASKDECFATEKRWLTLARSIEASERLTDFRRGAKITKDLYGVITGWNKGAEQQFGYSAEEDIGQPGTLLIPPERNTRIGSPVQGPESQLTGQRRARLWKVLAQRLP